MEKLTGVNSRIHQAREQKRDISVRSVSQDFRKLHHGQSPVFFTSARLKPNISHYFVLFSVCFSLHQINSRKITHFLLFFSCFLSCFLFLNIISTQENIPHYFPSSPAKLGNNKSRRNSRANGAATQSFELNFSSTRSFIAGFQSFGMLDVRRRQ